QPPYRPLPDRHGALLIPDCEDWLNSTHRPHIRERNRDTACEQFTRKGIAGNRFAGKPLFAYSDKAGKDWIFEGVSLMWAATAFVLLTQVSANDQPVQPDIIIRGAMIYDGSGQPGRKGDLAIRGDRIVGVGA